MSQADSDIFQDEIQDNREICDYCFRRIRSVRPPPPDYHLTRTLQRITSDTATEAHDGEKEWVPPVEDWRGDLVKSEHPQVVCQECGRIDSSRNPKKKGKFIKDSKRVFERLQEEDYDLDYEPFIRTVTEMKSDPKYCSRDYDILEMAIQDSITT